MKIAQFTADWADSLSLLLHTASWPSDAGLQINLSGQALPSDSVQHLPNAYPPPGTVLGTGALK